jgi:hypothetical protein
MPFTRCAPATTRTAHQPLPAASGTLVAPHDLPHRRPGTRSRVDGCSRAPSRVSAGGRAGHGFRRGNRKRAATQVESPDFLL